MPSLRMLALAAALLPSISFAQEEEWSSPQTPTPPPPPPELEGPPPVPPPEQPLPPPEQPLPPPPTHRPVPQRIPEATEAAPPEPEEGGPTRYRFAPSLSLVLLGLTPGPNGVVDGIGSLRTGLRYALLERSLSNYSTNLGLTIEVGLEGHRSLTYGQLAGFGVTARTGPAFVTRGGLFFPFSEFYALGTVVVMPLSFGTVITGRLGIGASFNAFAIGTGSSSSASSLSFSGGGGSSGYLLVLLALVIPKIELVWLPPTALDPNVHIIELRVGVGF